LNVGRKIYYEKSTGNVLVDTGERSGSVIETTTVLDFESYVTLQERVPETVGIIQLDYGQFSQDFHECNGYRINPSTLEIEFSYPDPSNPEPLPVYRKPLSEEVEKLKLMNAKLKDDNVMTMEAVAEVYEMVISLQEGV
jgi:hypothetical protein